MSFSSLEVVLLGAGVCLGRGGVGADCFALIVI